MSYRKDWNQPQAGAEGFARTMKTYGRTVTIGTADNVTGNTVGAFMLPAGFVVTGLIAVATDMDSGTPALVLTIGDAGNAARYFAAGTLGQSAGSSTTLASAGLLYKNTVDTEVLITVSTQSATAVAGTVDLRLIGYIDL
jgi:hypothetical protein